jgi:hypothetical protein
MRASLRRAFIVSALTLTGLLVLGREASTTIVRYDDGTAAVVPGEWVVRRTDGAPFTPRDLEAIIGSKDRGTSEIRLFAVPVALKSAAGKALASEMVEVPSRLLGIRGSERAAAAIGEVYEVTPNYRYQGLEFNGTWYLPRITQRAPWTPDTVLAPPPSVQTVYTLDTYAYGSESGTLESRVVRGPDFVGGSDSASECRTHGMLVAGVLHTVNPGAKIVSIRVTNCSGEISFLSSSAAFQWMLDEGLARHGVGPMNLSWGAEGIERTPEAAYLAKLKARGVISVAAAGNNNGDARFNPPCNGSDLCVGASTSEDTRASFSAWGAKIHIFAPGKDVQFNDGSVGYGANGTSLSAPMVAGALTLLKGQYPALGYDRLRAILLANATKGALEEATLGDGSPNRLLYIGEPAEEVGKHFFRFAKGAARFTASAELILNEGPSPSAWVDFYRGPKGPDGCKGRPYARGTVSALGVVTVAQSGWGVVPAKACFTTELGLVVERRVVTLP